MKIAFSSCQYTHSVVYQFSWTHKTLPCVLITTSFEFSSHVNFNQYKIIIFSCNSNEVCLMYKSTIVKTLDMQW